VRSAVHPRTLELACHAGGRGFESRRSRLRTACKQSRRPWTTSIGRRPRRRSCPQLPSPAHRADRFGQQKGSKALGRKALNARKAIGDAAAKYAPDFRVRPEWQS